MVRIRKHAALLRSDQPATAPKPQVKCELNLSPWDVTPFTPQSEFDYQFEIEDEFPPYESITVVEELHGATSDRSFDSLKETTQDEEDVVVSLSMLGVVAKSKPKAAKKKKDQHYVRCVKTDGKTWQCKKEAQQGEELCEHHLVQLESYRHKYYPSTKPKYSGAKNVKKAKKALAGTSTTVVANKKRNRRRVQTKPADYYYYSGFGPSWRKKRRGGDEITKEEMELINNAIDRDEGSPPSSPSQEKRTSSPDVQTCDQDDMSVLYEYEDDDDDAEEEAGAGKKRARKRIKARSLKSLF